MRTGIRRTGLEIKRGLEGHEGTIARDRRGELVISLDFELLWGVRDHSDQQSYGGNILGAREAIPRMLELFARHRVAATWATVGFLFCRDRDELMASLPPEEQRPRYANPVLSNYRYLDEVGADETVDPCYFGASLIDRIQATPLQEIGTHTMSHYYCLEQGQSTEAFEVDLKAARRLAQERGITLRSIVFPRNQFTAAHLDVCARQGLTAYRGTQTSWAYAPKSGSDETLTRRATRLIDQHTGLLGAHLAERSTARPADTPASQFLRPCVGRLAAIHPLHVRVLKASMTRAATEGSGFHLWWHPHNFGREMETNLSVLDDLLTHFNRLRDAHGMLSRSMDGSMAA